MNAEPDENLRADWTPIGDDEMGDELQAKLLDILESNHKETLAAIVGLTDSLHEHVKEDAAVQATMAGQLREIDGGMSRHRSAHAWVTGLAVTTMLSLLGWALHALLFVGK